MLTVFQVCFYTGIGLILLSFLLGNLLDAIGVEGLDLDFDLFGIDIWIPINPMLYILFFAVFGGVGWILMSNFSLLATIFIVLISIVSGIMVSALVFFLVIKPLKKAQNTSAPDTQELIGLQAVVTETIVTGGFGEIKYVINGNSFVAPAKATNGEMIKVGKEVAICWIKEHTFFVVRMDDM
jgi:membrane protein implicated in regulation of membrane protease activity